MLLFDTNCVEEALSNFVDFFYVFFPDLLQVRTDVVTSPLPCRDRLPCLTVVVT